MKLVVQGLGEGFPRQGNSKCKGSGVLGEVRVSELKSKELQSPSHNNLAWSTLQKCVKH